MRHWVGQCKLHTDGVSCDSGVSVGQHQEGECEQKAEQDKQEGAYAPDGCQDADDFVFACLWFHKD